MFGSKRRRAQGEEAQIKQAIENAQRVVQAYGAELEKSADQEIRNSGNLPFDENVIKNAIILLCKLTDDKKYREILIEGYVSLSSYQPLTKEASNLLDMFPGELSG